MAEIINLGLRKIGPGLLAYLKFKGFSSDGGAKLNIGTNDKVLEALSKLKMDRELFEEILKSSGHSRSETITNMLNKWISAQAAEASALDAMSAYGAIHTMRYYHKDEPYAIAMQPRLKDAIEKKEMIQLLPLGKRIDIFTQLSEHIAESKADCRLLLE